MALILIAVALLIGLIGYHWLARFGWIDSLLEASMILGGMGPINQLTGDAAKIFASIYALFSGLVFIGVMGIVFWRRFWRLGTEWTVPIFSRHLDLKGT